eukprot:gene17928-19715_t
MALNSMNLHVNGVSYVVSGIPKGTSYKDILCNIAKLHHYGAEGSRELHYNDINTPEREQAKPRRGSALNRSSIRRSASLNNYFNTKSFAVRDETVKSSHKKRKKDGPSHHFSTTQNRNEKHGNYYSRKSNYPRRRAISNTSITNNNNAKNRLSLDDSDIEIMQQRQRKLASDMKCKTHEDYDTHIYDTLTKVVSSQSRQIASQHKLMKRGDVLKHQTADFRKISLYCIDEKIDIPGVMSENDLTKKTNDVASLHKCKSSLSDFNHRSSKRCSVTNNSDIGLDNKAYRCTDDNDSGIPSAESEETSSKEENRFEVRINRLLVAINTSNYKLASAKSCPVLHSKETPELNRLKKAFLVKESQLSTNVIGHDNTDNGLIVQMEPGDGEFSRAIQEVSNGRPCQTMLGLGESNADTTHNQEFGSKCKDTAREAYILPEKTKLQKNKLKQEKIEYQQHEQVNFASGKLEENASKDDLRPRKELDECCVSGSNEDILKFDKKGTYLKDSIETVDESKKEDVDAISCVNLTTEKQLSVEFNSDNCSASSFSSLNEETNLQKDRHSDVSFLAKRKITEQNRGSFVLIDFDDVDDDSSTVKKTSHGSTEKLTQALDVNSAKGEKEHKKREKPDGLLQTPDICEKKEDTTIMNSERDLQQKGKLNQEMKEQFCIKLENKLDTEIKNSKTDETVPRDFNEVKVRICKTCSNETITAVENSSYSPKKRGNFMLQGHEHIRDENQCLRSKEVSKEAKPQENVRHQEIKRDCSDLEQKGAQRHKCGEAEEKSESNYVHSEAGKSGTKETLRSQSEKSKARFSLFKRKTQKNNQMDVKHIQNKKESDQEIARKETDNKKEESKLEKGEVETCDNETNLEHEDMNNNQSIKNNSDQSAGLDRNIHLHIEDNENITEPLSKNEIISSDQPDSITRRRELWQMYHQVCDNIYEIAEKLLYYDLLLEDKHFELKELMVEERSLDEDDIEKDEKTIIKEITDFKDYLKAVTTFRKNQRKEIQENKQKLQKIEQILVKKRSLLQSLEKCMWLKKIVHTPRLVLRKYNERKAPENLMIVKGKRNFANAPTCTV